MSTTTVTALPKISRTACFLAKNSSPSWLTSVIAYATHFVAAFTSCFARFNTIWTKVTIIAF